MNSQNGIAHILFLGLASVLFFAGCFLFFRINEVTLKPEISTPNTTNPQPSFTVVPLESAQVHPSGIPLGPQSEASVEPSSVQMSVDMDPTDWSLPIDLVTCTPGEERIKDTGKKQPDRITVKGSSGKNCIFVYRTMVVQGLIGSDCTLPKSLGLLDLKSFVPGEYCSDDLTIFEPN